MSKIVSVSKMNSKDTDWDYFLVVYDNGSTLRLECHRGTIQRIVKLKPILLEDAKNV